MMILLATLPSKISISHLKKKQKQKTIGQPKSTVICTTHKKKLKCGLFGAQQEFKYGK